MSGYADRTLSGMRWSLVNSPFVAFPHSTEVPHGWVYNETTEALDISLEPLNVNHPHTFKLKTASLFYRPVEKTEGVPDTFYQANKMKVSRENRSAVYGNQAAIQWIYNSENDQWRTGSDVFSWWHSPGGDLTPCVAPFDYRSMSWNAGISDSFGKTYSADAPYSIYLNIGLQYNEASEAIPSEGRLCYCKNIDGNHYVNNQVIIAAIIYHNKKEIYSYGENNVIGGIYVVSKTELIVAVILKFRDLRFERLTYNPETRLWQSTLISDSPAYEARTESGLDYYYKSVREVGDTPAGYYGLRNTVRFSQDGTECSFLQTVYKDTDDSGEGFVRTHDFHYIRKIVIELDPFHLTNIVVSIETTNYYDNPPDGEYPTQYDYTYFLNAFNPIAINYRNNVRVEAFLNTNGSNPRLEIGSTVYSLGEPYTPSYSPVYLDVISGLVITYKQNTFEDPEYGHFMKINGESVNLAPYQSTFDPTYKTRNGSGGCIDHRGFEKLEEGQLPPFVFSMTDYGYEGLPDVLPPVPVLKVTISNLREIDSVVDSADYPDDIYFYPIGLV